MTRQGVFPKKENKMPAVEKGKLSIHTENILPVIKKWLYSEKEIFVRELVSNAHDAIEKVRKISLTEDIYQPDSTDFAVNIHIDREKGKLRIEDNGVGMTEEEVKKFITQIAFSGAEEFAEKFLKDGSESSGNSIIGHFGLGFYSSFMVSKKVEIHTRSWMPDAKPVYWSSDGTETYEIGEGERSDRGTEVVLHLEEEDAKEYLDLAKISDLVRKYCDFIPVVVNVDGKQVNKKDPLWTKNPANISKEEYIEFYKHLYPFQQDPLFYIHLNVDYPFRLQGILYFPKLAHEMDLNQSNVKIYCQQIFVTDEAQDIIPKFLTALQGVIDLPDLPLNVSRSYVQNEPQVRKIASHIIKKVADRLGEELKNNRAEYEKIWDDVAPFVKYGILSDDRFYENAKDTLLYKVVGTETYRTLEEYLTENKTDKEGDSAQKVYYASDLQSQAQAIRLLQNQDLEVLLLNTMIDSHLVSFLETKRTDAKFTRVDAELSDHAFDSESSGKVLGADEKDAKSRTEQLFKNVIGDDKVSVRAEALKTEDIPAMILLPEQSRRMAEMMANMGQDFKLPQEHSLVVNLKNPLIVKLSAPDIVTGDNSGMTKKEKLAKQVYRLARLSQGHFTPEELESYTKETYELLSDFS